ncbi:leucyl/phenylalanyl-tRNA--protein transferase [Salinimicrobium sediminis]|uniref:Leucyl/phenylalanyl-tRNA--protein transferase n=1 Tax=Salinimicrobium sediminis TaxID=1343891 RepID=A0A285X3T6_9FLAO|nr:leucyl/phenylalanyl-tRNA--protein transferase [Salinimicrobium sediminis]SOC79039.1 leucyl/phenylalanyl-tRNA--protein transferase [Salinimicrobium sediminis]
MQFLSPNDPFPSIEEASEEGLLAVGGGLSPQRLLDAYSRGIFPWYDSSQPVLWWSPDPRMVLFPENLKISGSMKQLLKKEVFKVTFDKAFSEVVDHCANIKRDGQNGTWITNEMKQAYLQLHEMGVARSVEVWQGEELVGGLYGIYLKEKKIFCGESMFAKVSNASKYGFIHLVQKLQEEDLRIIDCQIYTPHLESLGAEEISRTEFLKFLK